VALQVNPLPQTRHLLILWAGIFWLVAEYVVLGPYSYIPLADNTELITAGLVSLRHTGMSNPLWDPMSVAGIDNMTAAYMTPISAWIHRLLPAWLAFQILVIGQFVAGVLALFTLCRSRIGLDPVASVGAALLFAVTLDLNLVVPVFAFMPVVLLGMTLVMEVPASPLRWILLGLLTVIASQASWLSFVFPFASVCVFAWFVFVDPRRSVAEWLLIIAVAVVLPLIRLDEFMAIKANMSSIMYHLTRPPPSPRFIDSVDFFLGYPPKFAVFAGAAAALVLSRFGIRRLNWLLAGVILMLMAPPLGQIVLQAIREMSGEVRGYRVLKFGGISLMMASIAAGYGLHLLAQQSRAWVRPLVMAVGAALLLLYTGHDKVKLLTTDWLANGSYVRNFQSPVIEKLAAVMRAEPAPVRAEPIFAYAGHLHAYGIETLSGDHPLIGRRYYEFWAAIQEPWIESAGGPMALWPELQPLMEETQFWPLYRREKLTLVTSGTATALNYRSRALDEMYRLNLLSFANVRYFVSREPLTGDGIVLLHDPGLVWADLSNREKAEINLRENFSGREKLYIYRNDKALPRFFTPRHVESMPTGRAVVERMSKMSVEELRQTLVVQGSLLPPDISAERRYEDASVTVEQYTSDAIRLALSTPGETLLVATNSYSPFWECYADGKPVPIFAAYHTFWGVRLPAHTRQVEFRFRPPYRRLMPLP
jgi:hypothetical protein